MSARRSRSFPTAAVALVLTATLLAACGGGSSAAVPSDEAPAQTTEQPANGGETAGTPEPQDAGTATAPIAALVPADHIQAALGETPAPECDTSVLTGAGSCIWTATDGSWLKIEDSTPSEMPDLESFTARVTGTLGLDVPVAGLGDAAYVGVSSRGTRVAVFMGDGRVVWVVLNKPGDATDLVTQIATLVTAEL